MKNKYLNPGFTLIEVLIALAMAALIFVVMTSVLLTFFTSNQKSQRNEILEQTKNDVMAQLSNTTRWAEKITMTSNSLTINDNVSFTFSGGAIYKNGERITSDAVEVTQFELTKYVAGQSNEYTGVKILVQLRDKRNLVNTDVLETFVQQRKMEVDSAI